MSLGTPDGPLWHDGRSWRDSAACADSDLDWFPSQNDNDAVDVLRAICASCPVRRPCLESELAYPSAKDIGGVRGGTTAPERRQIRKTRREEAA